MQFSSVYVNEAKNCIVVYKKLFLMISKRMYEEEYEKNESERGEGEAVESLCSYTMNIITFYYMPSYSYT